MNLRMNRNRVAILATLFATSLMTNPAMAQVVPTTGSSSGLGGQIVSGICKFLSPFVGSNSQVLSVVFLVALGVMVFLWWLNENKEGVMVWILRTGIVLAVLINIFTLPPMIGLPSVCGS